jgi:HSP20 family protein
MFGLTPYNRKANGMARRNDIWDMRNFFEDFFNDTVFHGLTPAVQPIRADVRETDKEFIIEAEIPGVSKEDIKLDLRDDNLTISVERNEQINEEKDNYIRRERRYGSYSRSFYLDNVEHDSISARYNDGVLTVTLPKSREASSKNRRIDIQ